MAKWPVGVALAGIVIGIMFFAMEQPWFTITIEYKPYAGMDGHTTEGRFYLTQWEAEDKDLDLDTGFISYDDDPEEGGWKGSYEDGGQEAKYEVYQTTYYLVLLTMLMAAISAVTLFTGIWRSTVLLGNKPPARIAIKPSATNPKRVAPPSLEIGMPTKVCRPPQKIKPTKPMTAVPLSR